MFKTEADRIESFKQKVIGINKERDYSILEVLAYQPELEQKQIIEKLSLDISQQRVSEILRCNLGLYHDMLMHLNPLVTKAGRISELIKHYNKKKNAKSRKDNTEIIEQVRRELDDKPLIDQSSHQHLTVVYEGQNGKDPIFSPLRDRIKNAQEHDEVQNTELR